MSATTPPDGAGTYTLGPSRYRKLLRPQTKPSPVTSERRTSDGKLRVGHDTGGGYERFRSIEFVPDSPTPGTEDVYAAHHRLLAVAWLFPDSMSIGEILAELDGRDVHHTTGVEWANFGESPNFDGDDLPFSNGTNAGLELLDHGTHSEVTQAQMRAWGEDAKRQARDDTPTDDDRCGRCDTTDGSLWQCDDFDGVRCIECAKRDSDGSPLEVA